MTRVIARAGSIAAVALTAHAAVNLRLLRRPPAGGRTPPEPLSVLLPVRNEAHRIRPCLQALSVALDHYGPAEVVVVDDCSTDATAAIVRAHADSRIRVLSGAAPPGGWLGKPHACQQAAMAAAPESRVLVFLDADVVLAPAALTRTVALLRSAGLDLVSPYPRQRAESIAERTVQPLLQWSWATFLPLRIAARSARASFSAANGQLLAVDTVAYHRSGGHQAVRSAVLDDIALLKSFKRSGFRGGVADGTDIATCRMYENWTELRDGYGKSLWAAFGSPTGAAAVMAALCWLYVLPPMAWLRHPRDPWLALGALGGVTGRAIVAHRVGGRVWPDSAAHPVSVLVLCRLTARSWRGHRRGALQWKERPI